VVLFGIQSQQAFATVMLDVPFMIALVNAAPRLKIKFRG
jgi:ACR3 family arsenite efflux pump ArsB